MAESLRTLAIRARTAIERLEWLASWWSVSLILATIAAFMVGTLWTNLVWILK